MTIEFYNRPNIGNQAELYGVACFTCAKTLQLFSAAQAPITLGDRSLVLDTAYDHETVTGGLHAMRVLTVEPPKAPVIPLAIFSS